jgi:mannose-6-phosphate isomerase-like protein (cupin superfamily)
MTRIEIRQLHKLDKSHGNTLENGCRFVECLNAGELGDLDATYISVPMGKSTRPHKHTRTRCFVFVVDGKGVVRTGSERRGVALNDFVLIPPGVVHSFEATVEPMTLLSLHSPALNGNGDLDLEYPA